MHFNGKESYTKMSEIKPINPTIIKFETEEEYNEFIEYATSTKKTDSPELNRIRELIRNHKRSKRIGED